MPIKFLSKSETIEIGYAISKKLGKQRQKLNRFKRENEAQIHEHEMQKCIELKEKRIAELVQLKNKFPTLPTCAQSWRQAIE